MEIPSSVTKIGEFAFDGCPIKLIVIDNCEFKILEINEVKIKNYDTTYTTYNIRLIIYYHHNKDDKCNNLKNHVIFNIFKNIGFRFISYKNLSLRDISYLTFLENLSKESYDLNLNDLDQESKDKIKFIMSFADKEIKEKMTTDGYRKKKRKSKSIKKIKKSKTKKKKSIKKIRKSKSKKKRKSKSIKKRISKKMKRKSKSTKKKTIY